MATVSTGVSPRSLDHLAMLRPRNRVELHRFVEVVLGLDVPRSVLEPGASPAISYLAHAFFEQGDALVWANRGGGKTLMGAVATLLDLIFKPGIQVRILGGSLEQSEKMYEHLLGLLDRPVFKDGGVLARAPTQRRIELANASAVELLAQSHRSVRGTRVHKLRCDEVEEFAPDLWQAAQLVTRSGVCGGQRVRGSVEALSTAHRPYGLMSTLLQRASTEGRFTPARHRSIEGQGQVGWHGQAQSAEPGGAKAHQIQEPIHGGPSPVPTSGKLRVFRWNALDVIERCPPTRPCQTCVLWEACQGRAKHASGFVPVDDLIAQYHRTDEQTWGSEMLCQRPSRSDSVYPHFEKRVHVDDGVDEQAGHGIGGMDLGVRSPTVFLWAVVQPHDDGERVSVVDEYIEPGLTLDQHMDRIEAQARQHRRPALAWLGVDPAGNSRNAHTGLSDLQLLRRRGYTVRSRGSKIAQGIRIVRRRLDHRTLRIHPRCQRLIRALEQYHFDPTDPERDEPIKDGPDHACDALRYLLINLEPTESAAMHSYL